MALTENRDWNLSAVCRMRTNLVDFLQPPVDAFEGPLVGDVVDQEDALGPAGVGPDDGAEPALAACVPQLKFDSLAVDQDRRRLKSCKICEVFRWQVRY